MQNSVIAKDDDSSERREERLWEFFEHEFRRPFDLEVIDLLNVCNYLAELSHYGEGCGYCYQVSHALVDDLLENGIDGDSFRLAALHPNCPAFHYWVEIKEPWSDYWKVWDLANTYMKGDRPQRFTELFRMCYDGVNRDIFIKEKMFGKEEGFVYCYGSDIYEHWKTSPQEWHKLISFKPL